VRRASLVLVLALALCACGLDLGPVNGWGANVVGR